MWGRVFPPLIHSYQVKRRHEEGSQIRETHALRRCFISSCEALCNHTDPSTDQTSFLSWNLPDTRSRTSASVVEMGRCRVRYLWPAPYVGCWIRWLVALMRPLYNWKWTKTILCKQNMKIFTVKFKFEHIRVWMYYLTLLDPLNLSESATCTLLTLKPRLSSCLVTFI